MRRNRARTYTIDAENEEDFNKECEKALRNELSNNNYINKEKINELDEEYQNDSNYKIVDNQSNLKYFGEINSDEDLEDENNSDDILNNIEKNIIDQDEKNLELLCIYLKYSIEVQTKENNNILNENIFYRYKNPLHSLSGNAIYDLNIKEIIDDIINEKEINENNEKLTDLKEEKKSSLKDFISQNIKEDCTLKIMIMSNNDSTRNSFINKLFVNNIENNDNIEFEIKKKQIRLFNKNISLQIFNTSNEFHNNLLSKTYYQFANGFFIFIEASNHNIKKYLENIFIKFEKYLLDKIFVIFGVDMLFEQDCSIDGFNLKEFAFNKNCLYIPIKLNDFSIQNKIIINILYLLLIKKIDNKKDLKRKNNKDIKELGNIKNNITNKINRLSTKEENNYIYDITKMDIPNSLGYNINYRINHINAFDIEKTNVFKRKKSRKLSGF